MLVAKVDGNGFLQMINMKITDGEQQSAYQFTTNIDDITTFDPTFLGIVQDAYPSPTYGENYEYVTPANKQGFHSEFIINDKTNNLVSQWNAYEFDANGHVISDPTKTYTQAQQLELVDGNSVNFAESAGGWSHHSEFDSNPVSKYDPEVRKKIGKEWKSPRINKKYEDFFDIKNSEKKANIKLGGDK